MERAMLKLAFAISAAMLSAVRHVFFAILALLSTRAFAILFDARFFGANVGSLLPKVQPFAASRNAGPHDRHVLGRGLCVGLAVQSTRGRVSGHPTRESAARQEERRRWRSEDRWRHTRCFRKRTTRGTCRA